MGASLAKVVASVTWAARLKPQARMLFVHMALTAKDSDKPPLYFGGRDSLVLALLGDLAKDPEKRQDQYRYIRRLLRELRDAGGITVTRTAVKGEQTTAYALHVLGDDLSPSRADQRGRSVPTKGDDLSPQNDEMGTNRPQNGDDLAPQRNHQEPREKQDLAEDPTQDLPSTYVRARARYAPRAAEATR